MKKENNLIIIILISLLLEILCVIAFNIFESAFTFLLGDNISAILSGLIVVVSCILLLYHFNMQYRPSSFKVNFFYGFIIWCDLCAFEVIFNS